jgi:flagellar biogenesis protein FliO
MNAVSTCPKIRSKFSSSKETACYLGRALHSRFRFVLLSGVALSLATPAFALTSLRQVKVTNGPSKNVDVSFSFDKRVDPESAEIEFLKDVIQITLKDTAVYPPKIIPVNEKIITKVFAYQFSPKTVRCRLFVKGNAEDYKDRVSISRLAESGGKGLSVRVAPLSGGSVESPRAFEEVKESENRAIEKLAKLPSNPNSLSNTLSGAALSNPSNVPKEEPLDEQKQEQEEKALLEKVVKASNGDKIGDLGKDLDKPEKKPLTGGKALPSFKGVFLKLGGVTLFALFLAWGFMKLRGTKRKSGVLGAIQRMANGALLPKNERLIQVVSTHHIDPKKSIAVVKIAGRLLVLGLSNDSINLITQFGDEGEAFSGSELAERSLMDESPFTDLLRSEKAKPSTSDSTGPSLIPSVRNRIKSRLEGLKPL